MRQLMVVWLSGSLAFSLLTSCTVPEVAPGAVQDVSGLQGVALRGPVCPGPARIPPDPKCADAPFPASLKVTTNDGTIVARFTTGKDGTFRISLAPGTYTVSSDQAVITGRFTPAPVTVTDQAFTTIELHFDSGIR